MWALIMRGLLDIHILDASFLLVVYGLSTAAVAYLVIRRSTRSKPLILIAAALIGAGVGLLAGWIASGMWDFFGISFTLVTRMWISLAFAAIAVAVTNFRDSRWPRKAIASLSIGLFVLTAAVGINVDFGMFGTIKAALGAQSFPYLATTALHTPSTPIAQPLWKTWSAPAGMPARGTIGTVTIPATVSGFHARHALVYLPPAARVPNPPRLPVLMMLSGQPGAPYNIFDSARLADVLDSYSKAHAGLAPIVVVPDQLGSAYRNPMCVDSALGNSATYLTVDVRNWVLTHLNVEQSPRDWAIGGYSQGGTCSIQLAAAHPQIFGNLIDVSGELAPGDGSVQKTIRSGFAGSAAAYAAAKPLSILAAQAPYPDSVAIFGVGQNDPRFAVGQHRLAAAAAQAGMQVTFVTSPGTAHDWHTVRYTVERALPLLYARWGLSG